MKKRRIIKFNNFSNIDHQDLGQSGKVIIKFLWLPLIVSIVLSILLTIILNLIF